MSVQDQRPDSEVYSLPLPLYGEQSFRALIEHSADAIALLDSNGVFLYVSPVVQKFLGYTPEELVGRNGFELIPADQLTTLQEYFATVIANPGYTVTGEHKFFHKDGTTRWLESTITNWLHDPSIGAVVTNFHDITARRQTEILLAGEKQALELMARGAPLNETLEVLTRLAEEQATAEMLASILLLNEDGVHLEHAAAPSLPSAYNQAINGIAIGPNVGSCGTAAYRNEAVYVSDIASDPLWIDFRDLALAHGLHACWSTPIRGSNGQVLGTFALYYRSPHLPNEQDQRLIELVTQTAAVAIERKWAEAEEKKAGEERSRLAAIVTSSDDAIISKTLDGIITSWNDAAERLFGHTANEAIGQHITLIIPPELYDEEREIISNIRQGRRIQHFETTRVRKDGSRIEVSLSISPVKDRTGRIIGAAKIARDVTERREFERRKDEFISMASHELKTPVTSIKGFTQLLLRRFKQRDDQESLRFLSRMDGQLNKLAKLINDLLDISKMQTGQLEYRKEAFDLVALAQEIVENVQGTTQTHRLLLKSPAHVQVFGDRDRIGQVLINLLTNAIKYSSKADTVLIRVAVNGENALVSVQDFGIGIAEADQKKVFERFYQVSEPDGNTYPGLGIGLYISSEIIKRHDSRIWVESQKGKGSTFFFSLPLFKEESPQVGEY